MSASKKQQQQPASTPVAAAAVAQPATLTTTPAVTAAAPAVASVTAPAAPTAQPQQHYYPHPGANYYSHYSYASYHPSTWASHLQAQGRTMGPTSTTPGVATPSSVGTPQHQAYYQTIPPVPPSATPTPFAANHSTTSTNSTTAANATSSQSQTQTQTQLQLDTSDIATLNDALGSAGVDLRAEEENLRPSHLGGGSGKTAASTATGTGRGRGRKQGKKVAFEQTHLGTRMKGVASKYGLGSGSSSTTSSASGGITEDSIVYIALALRARLTTLVEAMVAAAAHREETGYNRPAGLYPDGTPMWSQIVRRDVAKQLAVIEKVEREEELTARRERKARETYGSSGVGTGGVLSASVLPSLDDALQMDTTEDEPKKKKKKPDGPGVTAKNMTEDVRKKLSNAVASQAAGLGTGKYAWMNAGASAATIPKKPAATSSSGAASATPAGGTTTTAATSSWSRPFQSTKKKEEPTTPDEDKRQAITLRDAIFVIERDRGHGGGRGSARGWT